MSAPKSTATKKAAEAAKISSPADFKKAKSGRLLPMPSGLTVKARRIELRTLIAQGDVPNPLIPIVEEALNKGLNVDAEELISKDKVDLNMVNEMYEMVNTVAIATVVEPKVHQVPESEDDRDDDLVYVDELEDEDKMFLFQWALGGTDDIATFRKEAQEDLASLAEGEGAVSNA